MEFDSRKIFLKLFYDEQGGAITQQNAKENASLLDFIRDQTLTLQRDLNPNDRAILDSHLTAVREVEQRLEQRALVARDLTGTQLPPVPKGPLDAFDEQVKLLFDMIAIAYRADITRVVSFMMAAERTNRTYDHIGVPDSFHAVSHHANVRARIEKLIRFRRGTWTASRSS
jgi:hypothetical protein